MLFLRNTTGIEIGETDLTIAVVRSTFGKKRLIAVHPLEGFVKVDENERRKKLQGTCI